MIAKLSVFLLGGVLGIGESAKRTVAITVDDLPYASGNMILKDADLQRAAIAVNRRLLAAFRARHVDVTGFVIQSRVEQLGNTGTQILQRWIRQGLDLGNHTYSHPEINALSVEEIQAEIVRGETAIRPLMASAGRELRFFRFPENHTGDTKAKHDAVLQFLAQRGYAVATCTIDSSDYIFNEAYVHMLASGDRANAERVHREYLEYTAQEVEYYAALNKQVLGYEPPEVMLLHANRLNADAIGDVLAIFTKSGYKFVSLTAAQSDAAYHEAPQEFITRFGPMWGYRWAAERNVKINGSLEAEPPRWVFEYNDAQRKSAASR